MAHRRIPKKNRKKLKSVDPFNTKANSVKFQDVKNRNNAPVNLNEEQPLTKSLKNLMKPDSSTDKTELKKKKKHKNAVLQQANDLGLKKGRFETVERFVRRVEGIIHSKVRENMTIAKQGLAGRKQEEIDADYAKIEEAEKRRKEQERREIENKIKEARKRREQDAAKKEEIERLKAERKRKAEEQESYDEDSDCEEYGNDMKSGKIKKKSNDEASVQVSKKLNKKERRKETLKTRKCDEQQSKSDEAILNAKEVIEFGERYDAPPTFGGHLKKKFEPLMAKAGQKELLLHSLLNKGTQKTEYLESNKKNNMEEERLRVIEMYRQMKKGKKEM